MIGIARFNMNAYSKCEYHLTNIDSVDCVAVKVIISIVDLQCSNAADESFAGMDSFNDL